MGIVLGPTDEFGKKPKFLSSSASGLGDPVEKPHFDPKTTEPHPYNNQNSRLCPTQNVFQQYQQDFTVFGLKCHFSSRSPGLDAELDNNVDFLPTSSVGPSTVAIFMGRRHTHRPKIGNDYKKRGAILLALKNANFIGIHNLIETLVLPSDII